MRIILATTMCFLIGCSAADGTPDVAVQPQASEDAGADGGVGVAPDSSPEAGDAAACLVLSPYYGDAGIQAPFCPDAKCPRAYPVCVFGACYGYAYGDVCGDR